MRTHSPYANSTRAKELFSHVPSGPRKQFGQNFICNTTTIDMIVDVVSQSLQESESIVEIGGGLGAFSVPLAGLSRTLTIYEIDPFLFPVLTHEMGPFPNVSVVNDDFLTRQSLVEKGTTAFVFGALPYAITSPIFHLLIGSFYEQWRMGVFIIQKEVAEKMLQEPPQGSYWHHFVSLYFDIKRVAIVSPSAFWPQPTVESTVLSLTKKEQVIEFAPREWSRFLHGVFSNPRKKVSASISGNILGQAGVDGSKRPHEITTRELIAIARAQKSAPMQ